MTGKFFAIALACAALLAAFVSSAGSARAYPQAQLAPALVAEAGTGRASVSQDNRPSLPDGLPLHTRDELGLIVRQLDSGDVSTARAHWRRLVASEARAGRGDHVQRYLDWVLAQAYRDETRAADELLDKNRFYDRLQRALRQHEQAMQQLHDNLGKDEMRVVRTVAHLPIYRTDDPPAPRPLYALRQMDRGALDLYLEQLHRDIANLGRNAGLTHIDLQAAQTNRARLAREISEIAGLMHEDAVLAASGVR